MSHIETPMPVMPKVGASEFQNRLAHYRQIARREPIEITKNGSRDLVLLSAEQYDWLLASIQRSHFTADAPEVVIKAVKNAKMDPEHESLNELLK